MQQCNKVLFLLPRTQLFLQGAKRTYAKYYGSKLEQSPDKYTEVEKSYDEWKYVERLLPPETVPEPPRVQGLMPSGWSSQNLEAIKHLPYFVPRTKNHMIPVYMGSYDRGQKKSTKIRHVEGNIWKLEEEVGKYLKRKYRDKAIVTFVHEAARYVQIHGDYEVDVKNWLQEKGF